MKYDVNDYFRNYLMFLSDKEGLNLSEKDISTYLRALSDCILKQTSIRLFQNYINFDLMIDNNLVDIYNIHIDTTDNSLYCRIKLQDTINGNNKLANEELKVKLVNDKLYYSIYFDNSYRKDLNGIYFYEADEVGNTVYKFYDNKTIEEISEHWFRDYNLINADDFMLRVFGFSPDYEEKHEYTGMLEFDAARAFNDLLLTMNHEKAIAFMSSINKETEEVSKLRLGKRM